MISKDILFGKNYKQESNSLLFFNCCPTFVSNCSISIAIVSNMCSLLDLFNNGAVSLQKSLNNKIKNLYLYILALCQITLICVHYVLKANTMASTLAHCKPENAFIAISQVYKHFFLVDIKSMPHRSDKSPEKNYTEIHHLLC